ncbi:MAG: hypothetical protein H6818_20220 [Phycisphaerales bacterium]|nr:hypothetical protein [Phycisphaerales bacterium]
MRSDRRHELQTNELSTQLEKVTESVKQNATLLTAIVGGAIVVVAIGIWFVNQRATAQTDAWSRLAVSNADDAAPADLISKFEAVAKDNVTPEITRSAWLKVSRTALSQLIKDRPETEAPDPEARKELLASAEEAFNAVVANPGKDITALGRALMGLGTIAEDRGEFDKAKGYYEKVKSNKALQETPIAREAEYRLAHIGEWSTMITFAEPAPTPLLPEGATNTSPAPGVFTPPADVKPMVETSPASDAADTNANAGDNAEEPATDAPADAAEDAATETAETTPDNG